tara:strand:- start:1129 stop:1242 length:114 start_codon:yes stop_codon:yes gene_type:complete
MEIIIDAPTPELKEAMEKKIKEYLKKEEKNDTTKSSS